MFGYRSQNPMFSECPHSNIDSLFVEVFINNFDHIIYNLRLKSKLEVWITVRVVEYHFINVNGNAWHLFHQFLFLESIPFLNGEQDWVLFYHVEIVPEVASEENSPHVPLKQNHWRARDVFGIEKPEVNENAWFYLHSFLFVEIYCVDILNFGIFVDNESLCDVRTVDVSIVPQSRKALVMVWMKMSQKMDKSSLGERLTEIKIINDDVCVCNHPRHIINNFSLSEYTYTRTCNESLWKSQEL